VREFHLRRRFGEPWVWGRNEPDGSVTPVIGSGTQIVYVGKRKERPLSWSEPVQLIEAGLREAARLGRRPVAVVPSVDLAPEAHTVIVAPDLLSQAASPVEPLANASDLLVFPGNLAQMETAIRVGRLPPAADGLVFEDGAWRSVLPACTGRQRVNEPAAEATTQRALHSWWGPLSRPARQWPWARRLQPHFDRREEVVLATLERPGDFPYRMSHVFERRVLLAIGTLGSGGAERQLINTAEGLVQRGIEDVHVLVNKLHDDPASAFYLDRARSIARSVHPTPKQAPFVSPWSLEHPEFRAALSDGLISLILSDAQVIKELAPQVVHCSLDWTNITVGMAAVLAGVPQVFLSGRNLSPRYFAFFQWFMYPCYRALAKCAGVHLLNNSEAGRADYAQWLRLPEERIRVLRNGLLTREFVVVDDQRRAAARAHLGVADDAALVVGAFRLSHEKRPLLWVDTAARIAREMPNSQFLLCGVGPLEEQVRARAATRGIASRLKLLGARSDIHEVFAAADVVLQTSLQEGTPNVLIEAQASGIPVVTTPAYGAAEAVLDGITGRVVNSAAAGALAAAVLQILRDPTIHEELRSVGPKFVEDRFGFERMIEDTLSAYAVEGGLAWAAAKLPIQKTYAVHLPLDEVRPDTGLGWIAPLPSLKRYSDSPANAVRSTLVLLEDGVALGPAHARHDAIREQGSGAYSHWGEALFFSTPDGSDPRNNGRSYSVAIARR
jgi:glycosyltransferase involved in cell wall biosynthesis